MARGYSVDRVELGGLAIERNGDDRLGARGDRCIQQRGVKVVACGVDIDINDLGTKHRHGLGGGDIAEAGGNDFIPGTDPQCHQRDLQSIGAIGDGDGMGRPGKGRQPFLKLVHLGPEDILSVGKDTGNPSLDLGA